MVCLLMKMKMKEADHEDERGRPGCPSSVFLVVLISGGISNVLKIISRKNYIFCNGLRSSGFIKLPHNLDILSVS